MLTLPRGMRDFDGQDSAGIEYMRRKFLKISSLYGFEHVDPSPLEALSTLETRSGPAIRDEIYHFEDKGGRDVALRFDFTMGLARRASQQRSAKLPSKVSSFGGVFRYDEPQKGRYRYFHQWDLEIFGRPTIETDAEILEMTSVLFEHLGLKDVSVRICHRGLVESKIRDVFGRDAPDNVISGVLRAVDKAAKKPRDEIIAEYCGTSDKSPNDHAIKPDMLSEMLDFAGISGGVSRVESHAGVAGLDGWDHISSVFDSLESRGVRNATVDLGIVRGLDYYSGMVFEVFDIGAISGGLGALAGGGRYDALTAAFGRKDLGAAGVAGGVERTLLAMRERGLADYTSDATQERAVAVLCATASEQGEAAHIAALLRRNGIAAESDIAGRSLKKQLGYASQRGSYAAVILGPRELERNSAILRIMDTKDECTISLDALRDNPRRTLGIS